ncbi:MAG: NAD-dependent epimerase/dehydratase family protein [Pirellulaceae bacterium]
MSVFVITGGAGFIGSHLAERCLLLGHEVIVVDDLSRGSRDNVAHLVGNPRFVVVEASVCDRRELAKHVSKAFAIFHLAASPAPSDCDDWRTVLQQNYDATAAVLDVATRFGTKVVVASSGDVYQSVCQAGYVETDAVDLQSAGHHQAVCKLSKIVDECLARESKTNAVVARLFPTIGPRLGSGLGSDVAQFVVRNMIRAMRGQAILVDGDLPNRVSLIDVADLVHWMLLLACDPRADGRVFNLGSPVSIPPERLADKIREVTDARVAIRDLSSAHANDRQVPSPRIPDISQVVALTYHRPRAKLEDSLRRIYKWLAADGKFVS